MKIKNSVPYANLKKHLDSFLSNSDVYFKLKNKILLDYEKQLEKNEINYLCLSDQTIIWNSRKLIDFTNSIKPNVFWIAVLTKRVLYLEKHYSTKSKIIEYFENFFKITKDTFIKKLIIAIMLIFLISYIASYIVYALFIK